MTWGELKAKNVDTPDDADVYMNVPDENDDIPEVCDSHLDDDGDLILEE